ncbi:MAG: SpoIIE family protein phosphatase [Fusobacteriaceae bacterium]
MDYFIDVSHKSINKKGEELCGDNVEIVKTENGVIIVLSDGLGSGVKANILATLTSKIAVTMLKEGASIDETIYTIANTLPECKVRNLAYSTFTIIKMNNNGDCSIVEYDNPAFFLFKKGKDFLVEKKSRIINGKKIFESNFILEPDDLLAVVSDGAVHAGIGQRLNLGWRWDSINDFLRIISLKKFAGQVCTDLLGICNELYAGQPGDDTTVLAVKLQSLKHLDIFIGPPGNPENDKYLFNNIRTAKGKIILSGGTTANIVAKEFREDIDLDLKDYLSSEVPPIGYLKGVDLVTEGLITINKTIKLLKEVYSEKSELLPENNGAYIVARMLLYEATHVNIWAGTAVNSAHQNPDFPIDFNIKLNMISELEAVLKNLGKVVQLRYL